MKNLVKLKAFNKSVYITNQESLLLKGSKGASKTNFCYINQRRYIVSNLLLNQILNAERPITPKGRN